MEYPLSTTLSSEVHQIIRDHIDRLSHYTNLTETGESEETREVIYCFERLAQICDCPPDTYAYTSYEEAIQRLSIVEEFLRLTKQQKDSAFYKTYLGHIYAQANRWCSTMGREFGSSVDQVWELIAPVMPDCLSEIQSCVYEAKWWKPVPLMDIEILKRTEGVIVYGDSYETYDLPNGLAVRFSVKSVESKAP